MQIYYYSPNYDSVYKAHLGSKFVDVCTKKIDGYTLHRLPYYETKNIYKGPGIQDLYKYLEQLEPDVPYIHYRNWANNNISAQ